LCISTTPNQEIPEFEKTVPGGWVSTVDKFTAPLYDLPFDSERIGTVGVSKPLVDDRMTRFVVGSKDAVYFMEISHDTGCPQFTRVVHLKGDFKFLFSTGIEKIFIQHLDSARTISVDWASDSSVESLSSTTTAFPTKYGPMHPIFDEESGRVLQNTKTEVTVVDTATYFLSPLAYRDG